MSSRGGPTHKQAADRTEIPPQGTQANFDPKAVLQTDAVFWTAIGLLTLTCAPYLVPALADESLSQWRWLYSDVVYAFAMFLAVVAGISRVRNASERRLWTFVGAAYGVTLLVELLNVVVPIESRALFSGLTAESLYLLFFLALLLAAGASRGERWSEAGWRLDRLRAAGLGIVGLALVLYFEGVPGAVAPAGTRSVWAADLFLFALLDVVVCLAFLRARSREKGARWRRILGGLAAVGAAHAILDLAEALLYIEPLSAIEMAPAWDLFWFVPGFLIVFVARLHLGDPEASEPPTGDAAPSHPDKGSLVLGLMSLPLIHSLLYYAGVLDPALRETREGVVVAFLATMGAFTLLYLRTLEQERNNAGRELTLSEERYRSFVLARTDTLVRAEAVPPIALDQTPESILEHVWTRLRVVEASGYERLGLEPDGGGSMVGRPIAEVLGLGRVEARSTIQRWIGEGFDLDQIAVSREEPGGTRYYECALHGVVETNALIRAWVTQSDVTARRRAELDAERLEQELEHARRMESIGTLAGGIAHDFNNLLVPIMGYTELAMSGIRPDDAASRESLAQVLKASRRGAALVQQVLSVSRDQPRSQEPVDVAAVVDEALTLLRRGLPATIRLDTRMDEGCPPVLGDPSRLHQVIMNLCTNAAQAIGQDHGCITVTVRCDPNPDGDPPGWVVIEVRDDGPGMTDDVAARVFEPFYTTRPAGEATGLGLSTVHGIVTSHGGTVSLETRPSEGSVFEIRLPATDVDVPLEAPSETPSSSTRRIVVVDDEPAITDMTEQMLRAEGHSVRAFTDPLLALDAIREEPGAVDVLLTDQTMPGMTGHELARSARELVPSLPIIIMSGYHLRSEDFQEEDYLFLDKPFTLGRLSAAILATELARGPVGTTPFGTAVR